MTTMAFPAEACGAHKKSLLRTNNQSTNLSSAMKIRIVFDNVRSAIATNGETLSKLNSEFPRYHLPLHNFSRHFFKFYKIKATQWNLA